MKIDDAEQVRHALRARRNEQGMTSQHAAAIAGIAHSTYVRFETGNASARISTTTRLGIERLAVALDVDSASATSSPAWARYLTELRLARKLTISQAAHRMGVSQPTWSGMESGLRRRNGTRTPFALHDDTLARLDDVLALTPVESTRLRALNAATPVRRSRPPRPWQQALAAARHSRRWSSRTAAALAGVRLETYRRWERDPDRQPNPSGLANLLDALGADGQRIRDMLPATLLIQDAVSVDSAAA